MTQRKALGSQLFCAQMTHKRCYVVITKLMNYTENTSSPLPIKSVGWIGNSQPGSSSNHLSGFIIGAMS